MFIVTFTVEKISNLIYRDKKTAMIYMNPEKFFTKLADTNTCKSAKYVFFFHFFLFFSNFINIDSSFITSRYSTSLLNTKYEHLCHFIEFECCFFFITN